MTELSVIINTYKKIPLAKQCIETVVASCQDVPEFEIIISDSTSTPEKSKQLKAIQHQHPNLISHVIENTENTGYPRSVNAGLKKTKGEYILVMNSDILVIKDAIPKMLAYLKKNKKVGLLGPQLLNIDRSINASCYRFYRWYTIPLRRTALGKLPWAKKHINNFLYQDWDHKSIRRVDWLQGSVMFLSRETLNDIGPMDGNIFLYLEDVDWCRRAWQSGREVVYFPEAQMVHHHAQESANKNIFAALSNKMTRIHIKSALYIIKKYWKKPFPKSYKDILPKT